MPHNDRTPLAHRIQTHVFSALLFITISLFSAFSHAAEEKPAAADQQKASYAALADILQDDKARAQLITHLRQAAGTAPAAKVPAENTAPQAEQLSLIDQLVDTTQQTASGFMKRVQQLKDTINSGPQHHFNAARFFPALGYFLLTVAVTFAFFHLIRRLIGPLYLRLGRWGNHARMKEAHWYKLPASIIGAFAVDLGILLLTVAAGNLFTQYFNGGSR